MGANKPDETNPFFKDLQLQDLKDYIKYSQEVKQRKAARDGTGSGAQIDAQKEEKLKQLKAGIDQMNMDDLRAFFMSEDRR